MIRNAACLATALAIAACTGKSHDRTLDVVKIADRGLLTNGPLYIADEEGFFAKEGIRLEYTEPPRSTSQILPLLERGELDVVTSSVSPALYSAIEQGARIRLVADRGHVGGCVSSAIMAKKGLFDTQVPTAQTIRGKRISLHQAGVYGYIADDYFRSLGLSVKDLDVVRLDPNLEAQALNAGNIDLFNATEPYLTQLQGLGNKIIGPANVYSPGAHFAVVEFGPTLLEERRDVGYRFIKAYLKGVRQYAEGKTARNMEILVRRAKIDSALLRKVCLPAVYPDGHLDTAELLRFQQWSVKMKYLDRVLGPDAGIDMSFVQRASKELGISAESK